MNSSPERDFLLAGRAAFGKLSEEELQLVVAELESDLARLNPPPTDMTLWASIVSGLALAVSGTTFFAAMNQPLVEAFEDTNLLFFLTFIAFFGFLCVAVVKFMWPGMLEGSRRAYTAGLLTIAKQLLAENSSASAVAEPPLTSARALRPRLRLGRRRPPPTGTPRS